MCDYSLEMYRSRPALVGEQYVLHRFRTGTSGFVEPADCSTAVCMPSGARLRLEGFSERVQHAFSLGRTAEVAMIRLPDRGSMHRDGVRFADGREVLLQSLNVGLSAVLLPRDLEAILDLKTRETSTLDQPITPPPIPTRALERFARHLAPLRLFRMAWPGTRASANRRLTTIDA
jgi:hypothetical protein